MKLLSRHYISRWELLIYKKYSTLIWGGTRTFLNIKIVVYIVTVSKNRTHR